MALLLRLVCVLGLLILAESQSILFNCHRQGSNDCETAGQCQDDGTCTCAADQFGYDCSETTTGTNCDASCASTFGHCRDTDVCMCDPKFYGDKCQNNVHEVKCTSKDELTAIISIVGIDKATDIFIEDQPECDKEKLSPVSSATGLTFSIKTDKAEDCHASKKKIKVDNKDVEATCVTLVVRFNNYVTKYDYKVQFCCRSFGDPNDDVVIIVGSIKAPETDLNSPNTIEGNPLPDVTAYMADKEGKEIKINDKVNVGDVLNLKFQLPKDDTRDLSVIKCSVYDTVDEASRTVFLDNGCMEKKTIGTKMEFEDEVKGFPTFTVYTKAIKFVDQQFVQYQCTVRVCADGDVKCKITTEIECNTPNGKGPVFKRDVGAVSNATTGPIEGEVWALVRVASPTGLSRGDALDKDSKCPVEKDDKTFMPAIIGFGGVIVILLVVVAVLCFCIATRRRRSSSGKE